LIFCVSYPYSKLRGYRQEKLSLCLNKDLTTQLGNPTKNIFGVIYNLILNTCVFLWHTFTYVLPLWMRIAFFCALSSLIFILFFDFNALVAPVMKMLFFCKVFFLKTLPSWIIGLYVALKKSLIKLFLFFGGWEAWSAKKLFRHSIRFVVTFVARFTFLTFLINLFNGKERKGIKNLPSWFAVTIRKTKLGAIIDWWEKSTARQKRLVSGAIVCVVLIAFGQTLLGISILVFDIVWEILIMLWRWLVYIGRSLLPIVLRFIPNAIGSFFTHRVVPFFTRAIPVFRDDVKVLFVRGHVRERTRKYKKNLLKLGRNSRPIIRAKISPLLPSYVREKKNAILEKTIVMQKPDDDAST